MPFNPLHITEAFNLKINESDLDFFDANLFFDSLLFIDPFLIKNSPIEDERNLYSKISLYLKEAFKRSLLVRAEQYHRDKFLQYLTFPEPKVINLGYTRASNHGSGLGDYFAKALFDFFFSNTAQKIFKKEEVYSEGNLNTDVFSFFVDGVDQDGISDLTANLIMDYLIQYTQMQCEKLGIPTKILPIEQTFDYEHMEWTGGGYFKLPENPLDPEQPIIFVPKRFLRTNENIKPNLKSKVKGILKSDPILKSKFARLIQMPISDVSIEELRDVLLNDELALTKFIKSLDLGERDAYDFTGDPLEFLSIKRYKEKLSDFKFPPEPKACNELLTLTHRLISLFRDEFERKDGWRDAWTRNKDGQVTPIIEPAWGRKFRGMGVAFFDNYPNITFLPEVESGNGELDFCVIFMNCKITIELKLLKNNSLKGTPPQPSYLHGITVQLPNYAINLSAQNAIYITGQHYRRTSSRINHDIRANEIRACIPDSTNLIKSHLPQFNSLGYKNIDLTKKPSFSKW
jgi:hypothetical protein